MKLFGWLRRERPSNTPLMDELAEQPPVVSTPLGHTVHIPADSLVEPAPGGGILVHHNGSTLRYRWVDGIPVMGDPSYTNPMRPTEVADSYRMLSDNIDALRRTMAPPTGTAPDFAAMNRMAEAGWNDLPGASSLGEFEADRLREAMVPKVNPHTRTCNHDPTHNWIGAGPCPYCPTRIGDLIPPSSTLADLAAQDRENLNRLAKSAGLDPVIVEPRKNDDDLNAIVERRESSHVDSGERRRASDMGDGDDPGCLRPGFMFAPAPSALDDPFTRLREAVDAHRASAILHDRVNRLSDALDKQTEAAVTKDHIEKADGWAEPYDEPFDDRLQFGHMVHQPMVEYVDTNCVWCSAALRVPRGAEHHPCDDCRATGTGKPSAWEAPEKVYGAGPVDIAMPGRLPLDKLLVIPDQHWADEYTDAAHQAVLDAIRNGTGGVKVTLHDIGDRITSDSVIFGEGRGQTFIGTADRDLEASAGDGIGHNRGLPGFPGLTREDVANGDGPSAERPFTDFYPGDRGMRTDDRDRKPGAKPRVKLRWSETLGKYIAVSGWS